MHLKLKTKKEFEEKIDELYGKWVSYEKELSGLYSLVQRKDVGKDVLSLLGEVKSTKKAYTDCFGEPNMLQKAVISMDRLMYKSVVLRPIRKVILEKDDKTCEILLLKKLEYSVTKLYGRCVLTGRDMKWEKYS